MRKLGRTTKHKISLLRNLGKSLIEHGQIETTLNRAKELRSFIEKLITIAKHNNLMSRRKLLSKLQNDNNTVNKLFKIGENNKDRPGGYTRVLKVGFRSNFVPKAKIQIISQTTQIKHATPQSQ